MNLFKRKSEEEIKQEIEEAKKRRENNAKKELSDEEIFALVDKVKQWSGMYENLRYDPRDSSDYGKYSGKIEELSIEVSKSWVSCWFLLVPYGIRRDYRFEVFRGNSEDFRNNIGFTSSEYIFADRKEYKKAYGNVRKKYLEQQVLKYEQLAQKEKEQIINSVTKAREILKE